MNDPAPHLQRRSSARGRWLLLLVLLPVILGAVAVAILGIGEYRSARQVAAEIARLRAAGEPVDDESLAQWFQANTSREGTAAWRDILATVERISSGDTVNSFPVVGGGKFPEKFVPGGDWPDEPRIAEFLKEVRPLIAQIEQAGRYPTPVWQPVALDGFTTLLSELQASRGIVRLLDLEIHHALYHRDTERALRGLDAMQITAAAFDWDICIVAYLVEVALRGVHRDTIRQSLQETDWELPRLDKLVAQVGQPHDVAARWYRLSAGERALALACLQGDSAALSRILPNRMSSAAGLWLFPSGSKKYLDHMASFQRLGQQGLLGISARARDWKDGLLRPDGKRLRFSDGLIGLFLPAVAAMATVFERDELDRRLTRTALAIKRYRLSEGRWPARLSDLASVGLEPKEWTALQAGPFGYQVDGDEAVLWAYDPYEKISPSRVRSAPPRHVEVGSSDLLWHVTRIGHRGNSPPK